MLVVSLLVPVLIVAASALADDSPSKSAIAGFNVPEAGEGIRNAAEGTIPNGVSTPGLPGELTDPTAAEGASLGNLDRGDALEVLSGVFGAPVAEAAGPFDDLHVKKFLAENVAVLAESSQAEQSQNEDGTAKEPGASDAAILTSTMPLRTEDSSAASAAVDLSLEREDDTIQSANPLVKVSVAAQLGEGISLPEVGVEIHLAGAPAARSASLADGNVAFFPEVAADSDFAVAPTLTGFETMTQIRTPSAPRIQSYDLTLPSGATLAPSGEGAEVIRDGQTLVSIAGPTAIDAEGETVPVSLDVSGETRFSVEVSPDDSTIFPILVDPIFQTYEWNNQKNNTGIYHEGSGGYWKSVAAEQWLRTL